MAVTGQFVIAREATFSWTAGSGDTQALSVVGFRDVAWAEWRDAFVTVPTSYLLKRRTMGILDARAALGSMFDKSGATPTSPGMASTPPTNPGTLLVTFASGKTKSCPGFIVHLDWNSQGGSVGPEQNYQYAFVASAENNTSTITTA